MSMDLDELAYWKGEAEKFQQMLNKESDKAVDKAKGKGKRK